MSEELSAKNYTEKGEQFGNYEFYTIGATSINELKKYKIVPNKSYINYGNKKPDGLIVDRRNKKRINVIAVIEYKSQTEFDTKEKKTKAFRQCNNYCQELDAKFGIITDTKEYYYINPYANEEISTDKYEDDFGISRRYSLILNEDGYELSHNFVKDLTNKTELEKSIFIIQRILNEITPTYTQLHSELKLNPKQLAKNVWQSIWLASGENPDKILSTFVEIFIFKYLSDLGVLTKNEVGVDVDFDSVKNTGRDICLKYYFNNVREYVKKIFPESEFDNTSIINGFILDADIAEHNHLFYNILVNFSEYLRSEDDNEIKLINIDPEFKSRLYEDFLKRSISQKNWGQFFTPRNVVKAIIEVSEIEKLPKNSIVGDPACGVGGFLLEPLLSKITSNFLIKGDKLTSNLSFVGTDRDPKVIIMAKANMLIYLSELLKDNPTLTKEFASIINDTFKSYHTSIIGSLSETEKEVFDLIMTNPPYVTKGISNYKETISNDGVLKEYYKANGMGVECYFIEKIINSLKPNSKAFVVIPDGLLNRVHDWKIRKFIKDNCIIDGIISLPIGTFYSTQKKTYILAITKKENTDIKQTDKVFSYVVTSIGESLDVYRVPIKENDLQDFVRQFKYFKLDKERFEPLNIKCKIFSIDKFDPKTNWCIDRWWGKEEKVELGIEEEINIVNIDEYQNQVERVTNEIIALNKELATIDTNITSLKPLTKTFRLSQLFYIKQGDAYYTLKRIKENNWEGNIPVYSSNTKNNGILGFIDKDYIRDKDKYYDYSLTWAIDGMAGKLFLRNDENRQNKKEDKFLFTLNNHSGLLIPKEKIEFYYLQYIDNKSDNFSKKIFIDELKNIYNSSKNTPYSIDLKRILIKLFNSLRKKISCDDNILLDNKGSKIVSNVINNNNEIIIKKGSVISDDIIKILKSNNIEAITIQPINLKVTDNPIDYILDFNNELQHNSLKTNKIIKEDLVPFINQFYTNRIKIDLSYVMKNIQPLFFQRTRSYGNKKLGSNQIEDIEIEIPIKVNKEFDVITMETISKEQDKLIRIKNEISLKYNELGDMEVVIQ